MYMYVTLFCCLFQLPAAVGEAPTFGFSEDMANKFFNPDGVRTTKCIMCTDFLTHLNGLAKHLQDPTYQVFLFCSFVSRGRGMKHCFLISLNLSWEVMLLTVMYGWEPCRKWLMLQNVSAYSKLNTNLC